MTKNIQKKIKVNESISLFAIDYYKVKDKLSKKDNFGWIKLKKVKGSFRTEGNFVVFEIIKNGRGVIYYAQKNEFIKPLNLLC